jgi:hypothetical protein
MKTETKSRNGAGKNHLSGQKASKQTEKRNEGKQAVKTHQELQNDKAAIAEVIETPGTPADPAETFLEWLETMPPLPEGVAPRYVTLKIDVDLVPDDWMILAHIAKLNEETIGEVCDNLLEDAIVNLSNGQKVAGVTLTPEVAR